MNRHLVLPGVLCALVAFSCDSGTGPDDGPMLQVSPTSITLTLDNTEAAIVIRNTGTRDLTWSIDDVPDCVTVSLEGHTITTGTDTVIVTLVQGLDVGEYSEVLAITSNGGDANVAVALSIDALIGIFPGVGAAKVEVGDRAQRFLDLYGTPDSHLLISYSTGERWHYLYYESIKVVFELFNYSSAYYADDEVLSIRVEAPYQGVTEERIGIGSALSAVVAAYGQPPEVVESYSHYYKYASLGITFYYQEGGTAVTRIRVYEPQ
jgi:hypothetical protein